MVAKFTILVVLGSALSIAMSAPNRGYGGVYGGGDQHLQSYPGQGHLGTTGQHAHGQQGGVYDDGQGQLGVVNPSGGLSQQQGGVYDDGQGHGHHGGHGQLGVHGHGQQGYGINPQPGQQINPGQQGGVYVEDGSLGGGYRKHGY